MTNSPNPTQKPAMVFDFGGVLLDWNPRYLYRQFFGDDEAAMERYLIETDFDGWNHDLDAGLPFPQGVAEQCARFPHYCSLIRVYEERYLETIGGAIQGTVEILRRLRDAGYPLFGLSNWTTEKFPLVRPDYEFFNWFEDILISGYLKIAKPDPRIYQILLQRVTRPAGECFFIDDRPENVAAALEQGIQAIQFQDPQLLEAELTRRGLFF